MLENGMLSALVNLVQYYCQVFTRKALIRHCNKIVQKTTKYMHVTLVVRSAFKSTLKSSM